jgi:16S rRNA C1402 N4-methylase RsmH
MLLNSSFLFQKKIGGMRTDSYVEFSVGVAIFSTATLKKLLKSSRTVGMTNDNSTITMVRILTYYFNQKTIVSRVWQQRN